MNLKDTKLSYFANQINKHQYIDAMFQIHQKLFEYGNFLEDTDIAKIEISDRGVAMTSRTTGVEILCSQEDKRLAPIEILNFNFYEKTDSDMIFQLVKSLLNDKENKEDKEVNFFDIGANIGWYSIGIAKSFDRINVFAFEPIPLTFEKLKVNIRSNKVNVNAYNFGFSNQEQELTFYYCPEGSGNASSANLANLDNTQEIPCSVKKLDDFVAENLFLNIDFIKCDVEGAELFVYQGGIESIKKNMPIIFTEMLRKWSAKFNYNPNQIIDLLSSIGYRCFTAKEDKLVEFFKMSENTTETNFFFLHSINHAEMIRLNMTRS
jgi:FkbM family methyltransferase